MTQLVLFHPINQPPRLRAATYGRGVWEIPLPGSSFPDFSIQMTSTTLAVYPSATATFQGMLTSLNGYAKTVSLSCYAAGGVLPQQCGNANSFVPTSCGTSFARSQQAIRVLATSHFKCKRTTLPDLCTPRRLCFT